MLTPPTLFVSHCHCDTCRRSHAAAFVTWTAVPTAQFEFTGGEDALTRYASSPGVERAFCRHCGSPVSYVSRDATDRVYVPVAVLDTIDQPPDSHVSFEERAAWLAGVVSLPCFRAKSSQPLPSDLGDTPEGRATKPPTT